MTGTGSAATAEVIDLVDSSKQPRNRLAGPYGHPFHPVLVTVPIGAWVCSLVFDIASRSGVEDAKALTTGSYWLIGIGIAGALLAAVFGLLDLRRIARHTAALRIGITHMLLNLTAVAMFALDFGWRHDSYERPEVPLGQLVLSAGALAVLGVSGWLGGMLAFRYGVRVAHEADQAEGFVPGSNHDA